MRVELKHARRNRKIKQSEMAERLGVSTVTVSNWETGKRAIKAKDLDRYLEIIGASRDEIFLPYELTNCERN